MPAHKPRFSFFDLFEKAFPFVFCGTFALIVLMMIVQVVLVPIQAVLILKVADIVAKSDFSNGVKPVIAQAWCGSTTCLDK
jgi:hypothetical protein